MTRPGPPPPLEPGQIHVWLEASPEQVLPSYVERPEITPEPGGKPRLADAASGIDFSKSDSGELTVVALTRGRRIGVDVERVDPGRRTEGIVARVFSANERAQLEATDTSQRTRRFYEIWTAKEARAKASGRGLSELLGADEDEFAILDLSLPAGYAGSIAIERSESDPETRSVIYSRLDG